MDKRVHLFAILKDMQFQMPQFIEIEDKIFGPFTLKQFIYLVGSAGLSFVLARMLPLFVALPLIVGVAGLGLALAFYQKNGRPFIYTLQSGFKYMLSRKMYLWRRDYLSKDHGKKVSAGQAPIPVPPNNQSVVTPETLHDLAWSLDVLDQTNSSR